MDIQPIRTEGDYKAALAEIEGLMDATPGSAGEDKLEVLATLVRAYEAKHQPIDPPDPIEAIKFRLDQQRLTRKDLESILGTRARVSEILTRQRSLSIAM